MTAAYLLSRRGYPVTVLEADPRHLGGLARTVSHGGYLSDIGPHRFFSKSAAVTRLWHEILGADFIRCLRKTRIYYRGKFFDYPLRAGNVVRQIGSVEAVAYFLSFLKARVLPVDHPSNFEEWVSNAFGQRLYAIFFKAYTEKVWGIPATEVSADWAAQRIKNLSLWSAVKNAFLPGSGEAIKTLIPAFSYPRQGAGMMWTRFGAEIESRGGKIEMDRRVVRLRHLHESEWEIVSRTSRGDETVHRANSVISSIPMRDLVASLEPTPPSAVVTAANGLRYRDHLTVGLVVVERDRFDDHWIYIHDPNVKVARIQNVAAWSPDMIPEAGKNCYVLEYFCFEGDDLWASDDATLVKLATRELCRLGLASEVDITEGFVTRQRKAYPVYTNGYADKVDSVRRFVEARCPGLFLIGRNGMHKYNNQDHSMMTAMLTVENIVTGEPRYDVWKVNQDAQYHEVRTTL